MKHLHRPRLRSAVVHLLLAMLGLPGIHAWAQYSPGIKIPDGYVQVEGDIIMTTNDAAKIRQLLPGAVPKYGYAPSRLWPNRVVPFDFDSGVTAGQKTVFYAAMNAWSNSFPGTMTISFRARSGEAGYVHFIVSDPGFVGGSTSYVGYSGGQVSITIHPSAVATFLIAHEIGHALGLWHEQSRPDRNSFITVNYGNIQSGYSSQFDIKSPQATFGTYDYDSIMHYFACAFSACSSCSCSDSSCRTMTATYSAQQCNIGQQNHLSVMDRRAMAFMYAPSYWKFLYPLSGSSADGSMQQPYTTVAQAAASAPAYSTVWIGAGSFSAAGLTITRPMTLNAAVPDLQLQSDGSLGPSPSGYAVLQ